MKQSEQITAPLGTGAVILTECSNTSGVFFPKLTILLPAWVEHGLSSESVVVHHPAQSMELHATQVEQLYAFLKGYYNT